MRRWLKRLQPAIGTTSSATVVSAATVDAHADLLEIEIENVRDTQQPEMLAPP